MRTGEQPRLYTDLAAWWPLFSPPEHYTEEAADLLPVLLSLSDPPPATMLELGAGGGSMASHFKGQLALTLSDLSEQPRSRPRTGIAVRAAACSWRRTG